MPHRLSSLLLGGVLAASGLSAALLGGLPGAAASTATASTSAGPGEGFTVTAAQVPVRDAGQTVLLDTDLYVPRGASPADPRPAIVMTNGFGLSKSAAEITSMSSLLARRGYVVLTYSASGFGASGGCVSLQSADHDIPGASQLITTVLDPRQDVLHDTHGAVVGTVGGSYGGGGQLTLAALDKRVHASVPSRTWNSLQYALDPNNYVAPGDPTGFTHRLDAQGVFKQQWTSLFFASGNAQPVGGVPPTGHQAGGCPQAKTASGDPVQVAGVPCAGYRLELCQTYAGIAATGDADQASVDLLARASAATFLDQVTTPVLLTQGLSDTLFNVNDALATYTALQRRGVPVSMIWNSGGHGGYDSLPGECEVYGGGTGNPAPSVSGVGLESCYLTGRTLAFLDHWLRGRPDSSPGFTYFRDWVPATGAVSDSGSDSDQYGTAAGYPAMGSSTFTLSGGAALVPAGTAPVPGTASLVNPAGGQPAAYTETSNFSGPGSNPQVPLAPTEQPGQSVSFTSPAFTTDTESVGVPSALLRLSHLNGRDLVLFGKVYDVAPDGSATLIHRLVAPVRIPDAALGAPVQIKLLGFAHRFAAGHAVRLTLASTDSTSRNATVADVITVLSGPGSTFTLPTRG